MRHDKNTQSLFRDDDIGEGGGEHASTPSSFLHNKKKKEKQREKRKRFKGVTIKRLPPRSKLF